MWWSCHAKSLSFRHNDMKNLNSLMYLFYYLLLWVVFPSSGLGEQISDVRVSNYFSIATGDTGFSDFQHCVNPDWNRLNRQETQQDWLSRTGHWPVLFSSLFKPQFRFSYKEILNPFFTRVPILGALTTLKIIFPFHYFW